MEFEGVRTITMSSVLIQILWQVDDLNGLKRAFLKGKQRYNIKLNYPKIYYINPKYNTKDQMICIHTLTHIPHPMHNSSEIKAILDAGVTSMHSFPVKECI